MQVNFFVLLDEMEKQYSNDSSNFGTEINNKELIQLLYNNCKIKCFFFFQLLLVTKVKWRRALVFPGSNYLAKHLSLNPNNSTLE